MTEALRDMDTCTNVHTSREFGSEAEYRAHLDSTVRHVPVSNAVPAPAEAPAREAVYAAPWRQTQQRAAETRKPKPTKEKRPYRQNPQGTVICANPDCGREVPKTGYYQTICSAEACRLWRRRRDKKADQKRKAEARATCEHPIERRGVKDAGHHQCLDCGLISRKAAA